MNSRDHLSSRAEAVDPSGPYADATASYFHGTSVTFATDLHAGMPLDASRAAQHKIDGPAGFFLASELADAEFFALRRSPATVLRYELSSLAMGTLTSAGAVRRSIPCGRSSPFFAGDELWIPPSAFAVFDRLRNAGAILVSFA